MSEHNKLLRSAAAFHRDITPTKKAADAMLSHLGQLMSSTAESAFLNDLPSAVSHPAMKRIGEAIIGTIGIRETLIEAHLAAKTIGREVLPELAWGDSTDTDAKGILAEPAVPHLRSVSG